MLLAGLGEAKPAPGQTALAALNRALDALSASGQELRAAQIIQELQAHTDAPPWLVAKPAWQAMRARDWAAALQAWQACLLRFPTQIQPDWLVALHQCHMETGAADAACSVYARLQAEFPAAPETLLLAARAARAAADDRQAVRLFIAYLRQIPHPPQPEVDLGLANALHRAGRPRAALAVWQAAISRYPDKPSVYQACINGAAAQGKWEIVAAQSARRLTLFTAQAEPRWYIVQMQALWNLQSAAAAQTALTAYDARFPHSRAHKLPPGLAGTGLAFHLTLLALADQQTALADLLLESGFPAAAHAIYAATSENPWSRAGLVRVALRRGQKARALSLVQALHVAEPQGPAAWQIMLAMLIEECGGDATPIRAALPPLQARIYAAHQAISDGAWAKAASLWAALLQEQPAPVFWVVQYATALARLGAVNAAQNILKERLQTEPWALGALRALLQLQDQAGQSHEMRETLSQSVFVDAALPALFQLQMRLFRASRDLPAARAAYSAQLRHGSEIAVLEALCTIAPKLYYEAELAVQRHELWEKLASLAPAPYPEETAAAQVLRARLCLGLRNQPGFAKAAAALRTAPDVPMRDAVQRAASCAARGHKKLFCIGLSRTGTTTMAAALDILGYDVAHWTNHLTGELLSIDDLTLFDGLSDIQAAEAFEAGYARFPGAKFIYTTRPMPEWEASLRALFWREHGLDGFAAMQQAAAEDFGYGADFRRLMHQVFFRHPSAAAAYAAHDTHVRQFFADKPAGCFLEFNVFAGDGWGKLCGFLGHDVPNVKFPFENKKPDH